jgi:hypothetical protein
VGLGAVTADPDLPEPLLTFLDQVVRVDGETVRALTVWEDDPDDVTRELARRSAGRAIRAAGLEESWRLTEEGLRAWAVTSRDRLPRVDMLFPRFGSTDMDQVPVRMAALPYVVDAAAALLLGDRLPPDQAEVLLRPWREVVG